MGALYVFGKIILPQKSLVTVLTFDVTPTMELRLMLFKSLLTIKSLNTNCTMFWSFDYGQCPAGRVFQYRVGSGRVLDKIPGSGSGSGRVGVSKNTIGYFRVSFLLSGISGYFGYFRVCRVFLGISGFTHIY